MAVEPTPVRSLGTKGADGCVLLRDVSLAYRDGGEEEVLRLITETMDLSSASDELIRRADGWAQTYHLHPARANIVRCLELPESARVLEIGAGCGAITRYLGETCMLVDALEPVPVRAAATRARTRDLDNVEVFVGDLADVPVDAAYDVIVVIGVLEYVGEGNADCAPYLLTSSCSVCWRLHCGPDTPSGHGSSTGAATRCVSSGIRCVDAGRRRSCALERSGPDASIRL